MPLISGIDKVNVDRVTNWCINGRMDIWQRGTSLSVPTSTTSYLPDRFAITNDSGVTINTSRITSVPTLSIPLKYAYRAQPNSTTAVGANSFVAFQYSIEGNDLRRFFDRDLHVYFYSRSNLVGTWSVNAVSSGVDRTYAATFTTDVANTWEKKHVIIPYKDVVGGTFNFDATLGSYLWWGLAGGTSRVAPVSNAWNNGDYIGVPGMPNFLGSTGNTFDIAGVVFSDQQLTDDEYLLMLNSVSLDEDLWRCQRYYQKTYDLDVIPGTAASQSGAFRMQLSFPANPWIWNNLQKRMRTAPTVVFYNPNTGTTGQGEKIGGGTFTFGGLQSGECNISYNLVGVNSGDFIRWHIACESEL